MEGSLDNFEAEVIQSDIPVLVDFWGPLCQPCLALMPAVEELADKFAGKLKVVKVNAQNNRRLCIELKVLGLPAFLLYKGGKEVGRLGPQVARKDLEDAVNKLLLPQERGE